MDAARFFAMLTTATSDALIACWDAKYEYLFWRPVTSIRAGGGDPRLTGDPNWSSLVTTPNHPEYPGAPRLPQRRLDQHHEELLRDRLFSFTIDSNVAGVTDAGAVLRELLAGDRRGDRRARVGRDALPLEQRDRRPDRKEGGEACRSRIPSGELWRRGRGRRGREPPMTRTIWIAHAAALVLGLTAPCRISGSVRDQRV